VSTSASVPAAVSSSGRGTRRARAVPRPRTPTSWTTYRVRRRRTPSRSPASRAPARRTAYLRLYGGEVTCRQRLTFTRREADGRTAQFPGRARELEVAGRPGVATLTAGNIAALRGVVGIRVGDRLCEVTDRAPQFAAPTLETLVRARHPDQAEPLRSALLALADQDPLMHARPAASGSTTLLLYGKAQKQVLAATLAQDFGIEAEFEPSRVRFLERPTAPARPPRRAGGTGTSGSGPRSGCGSIRDRAAPAASSRTRPSSAPCPVPSTRRSRARSTRPCSPVGTAGRSRTTG
jgi:hypothetical protein